MYGTATANARERARYVPGPVPGTWVYPRLGSVLPPNARYRPVIRTYTTATLNQIFPPVLSGPFMARVWDRHASRAATGPVLAATAIAIAWPWITFATMVIFRVSMRRAKIDPRHVLRAAVYGCDFGLLLAAAGTAGIAAVLAANPLMAGDPAPVLIFPVVLLACPVVGTYRLTFAYSRYLRFHLPFLTVLASQVVAVLFVLAMFSLTQP